MSDPRPRRRRRDPANPTPAQRARARARSRTDLSPPTTRRASTASTRRIRRRALAGEAAPSRRRPAGSRGFSMPALGWARSLSRVLVLAAEVALVAYLMAEPGVAADKITVQGLRHLTRQQVLLAGGLNQPMNIFMVLPEKAEAGIAANPYVRSVRVSTSLPGTVTVSIVEWQPLAVMTSGAAHFLINGAGTVLGEVPDETLGPGGPNFAITVDAPDSTSVGRRALSGLLLDDLDQMRSVIAGTGLTVTRYDLGAQKQLTAETAQGPRILFGQMATEEQIRSLDAKLTALKTLAAKVDLPRSKVPYINLENASEPALGPVPSPSPKPASPKPAASPAPSPHP